MSNEKYIVVLEPESDFPEVLYDIETGLTCFFDSEADAYAEIRWTGRDFDVLQVWLP